MPSKAQQKHWRLKGQFEAKTQLYILPFGIQLFKNEIDECCANFDHDLLCIQLGIQSLHFSIKFAFVWYSQRFQFLT